ncbi:hypothetical protein GJ744_008391 [Endocarpon pusillum]|uniref:Uncharacterized protein n=1 Tax=Endocarpon pusillum TaxID=364733 RepID=A0A8H7AB82_9EURO|nr:hypothetical protein GJ744_008391 [Endocarpon pusillum]
MLTRTVSAYLSPAASMAYVAKALTAVALLDMQRFVVSYDRFEFHVVDKAFTDYLVSHLGVG